MSVDYKKLVEVLKKNRESEGLSLRGLSAIVGISFSTLARIERGDGVPDNNSLIRLLEWLGEAGRDSGLSFENVAFVHFRAAKNAKSKTIKCLLKSAELIKQNHNDFNSNSLGASTEDDHSQQSLSDGVVMSKQDMEVLAQKFRSDLDLDDNTALDSLNIEIEGVAVFVPDEISGLSSDCLSYLKKIGSDDWSAMSVPLDIGNDQWAILRNDQHNIVRQRVTYLEECWHILLGHKLTKIAKISESYGRTYDNNEEHDAFYLASACLLPEGAVFDAVNQNKSATEIATKFGTSPELVEYRIKRLGLWRSHKGKEIKLVAK